MRGLWLEGGKLRLRDDLPRPRPQRGEALIRVLCAGICNTDLELLRGYHSFTGVPGHEFVGAVAAGPEALVGQRVVGEINLACGDCRACRRGHRSHCERRRVLGLKDHHGAFAEYLTLPLENLHQVPGSVASEAAVFVEPLAAALEIQQQVEIRSDHLVLIVGAGKLGQLIAQSLAPIGCRLLVASRSRHGSDRLARHGIATSAIDAIEDGSFDIAIECTGNAAGFTSARRALRPRGTLVLKSTYVGRLELDASSLVVDEITVVGSRCGPFEPALELLATGGVEVLPLIEARHSIEAFATAFAVAGRPAALKVLLTMVEDSPGSVVHSR